MTSTTSRARISTGWPWLLVALWALLQIAIASQAHTARRGPIDFLTYEIAANKLARGESPYATAADDLATWRAYHRLQEQLRDPRAPEPPVRPGPYLYPPTLALLIADFGVGAAAFAGLIAISIIAFTRTWLNATGLTAIWLLLVLLSWDIGAAASGGNVELVLLGALMAVARLLWSSRAVLAAPLVALVLLVKPFYALFFAAFVTMLLVTSPTPVQRRLVSLGAAAALTIALTGVEVYRWGPELRAEALNFMRTGIEHQWFVLPIAEQTPMSFWNRTTMQGLVNAGVAPHAAFSGALLLWFSLAAVTVWRVWNRPVGFTQTFALAFILLYVGRPVGWTLNYLEIVVVGAMWPAASVRMRHALWIGAVAVIISHWVALVLTATRVNLALLTLQTAEFPWETWVLLPLCWLLLLNNLSAAQSVDDGQGQSGPDTLP